MEVISEHTFNRKTILLMLTYACNLNCVYCYEKDKRTGKTMAFKTARKVIQEAFIENATVCEEIEIDFMGGEPLLEFDRIKEISEWMWSQNWSKPYILYATTNGTLLNEEMKKWFSEHKERIVLGFIIQFMANCKLQSKLIANKKELTTKEKKVAYALTIINKSQMLKKQAA